MVDIAIVMGSESDRAVANRVTGVLDSTDYSYDVQVISAHRNPDKLDEYVSQSDSKVYIAIAGLSAALPGVIASKTKIPVIGVPVSSKMMGLDALLSTAQMPPGVPVASVGVDNGANAAYLAIRILDLIQ